MENVLDVFRGDGFTLTSLTDRINRMPFTPGRVGLLNLFDAHPVNTTSIELEENSGVLNLIPSTPRGAPAIQNKHSKSVLRLLRIPRLALDDSIIPDEVQGVRVFGATDMTQAPQMVVDQRLKQMNSKHDATIEYGRIGALKGIIYDADGSTVLYNLYNEFGVSQQTKDYTFGTSGVNLLTKSTDAIGLIEDELGEQTYEHVHALCSQSFFSALISDPKVSVAYQYQQGPQSAILREDNRYVGVTFGGITYEQYRGNVGGIPFIPAGDAIAFPVGTPDLFTTYFGPADWWETVNTLGLPRYAKQIISPRGDALTLMTQSNPLSICKRPRALIRLFSSN